MSHYWKTLLCCFLTTAAYLNLFAQESCGFKPTAEQIAHFDRTRLQRQQFNPLRSASSVRWIPIQFQECIATSGVNASPRISYDYITPCLTELNALFGSYGIQFYECSAKTTFANNTLFGFDSTEEPQLSAYDVPNVINVYLFQAVSVNGGPVCGYSSLPPSADRIILAKGCTDDPVVFLHEMGHYLGLYHTHGKTGVSNELVNGSNCSTAGDEICDTPADPNLASGGMMYGCSYIGNFRDANGDLYQPDPTNIMSYAHVQCKNRFSPQQLSRMAYTALNDRAYLSNGCPHPNDCTNQITTLPQHFDFETGLENWSNTWIYPDIQANFIRGTGSTPTPNTGPDAAYSGNYYLYVESSVDSNLWERYGLLRSPCFDLRGYSSPKMSIRYHAFGNNILEYAVQASTDGGITWSFLPQDLLFYSNQGTGNAWQQAICDLSPYTNVPNVQFRIGCFLASGNEADFAVDDIHFYNEGQNCSLSLSNTVLPSACNGGSNGQITALVAGANGPVDYLWSTGDTTAILTGLSAGTYSLTVSDSLGCVTSSTIAVQDPPALQANLTPTNIAVPGQSTGSISMNVSGGVAPYYYVWSTNATTANVNGLAAGTYTVTVIDSKDCQVVRSATITEPASGCGTLYSSFPWSGSFESNFIIFERVLGYQTNWVRRSGATPNANTGPDAAQHGSSYAFINSTHPNRTAVLQTQRCLNLSGVSNPVLEFYYHMYGVQMGELNVEISTNNGVSWTTVWTLSGNQGNQWSKATIDLQLYNNGTTRIRFRGVTASNTSDMALDALYIGPATGNQNLVAPSIQANPIATQGLSVYPNPSTGMVYFEALEAQECTKLEVFNYAGQKIWTSPSTAPLQQIDLSKQADGIYLLRAVVDGATVVKKMMIKRN